MTRHLSLDLPAALVAKLEEQAQRTGASLDKIAESLLTRALEEESVWTTGDDGLPLYVGAIDPAAFDLHAAREERIDSFVRGALEGSR